MHISRDTFKEIYGIVSLSIMALLVIVIIVSNGLYAIRLQDLRVQLETVEGKQTAEYEKLVEEKEALTAANRALQQENRQMKEELQDALENAKTVEELKMEIGSLKKENSFLEGAYDGYRKAYERIRSLQRVTGTYNGDGESQRKAVDILEDNHLYTFSDDNIYNSFIQSIQKGDRITLLYFSSWGRYQIIGFYPENQ